MEEREAAARRLLAGAPPGKLLAVAKGGGRGGRVGGGGFPVAPAGIAAPSRLAALYPSPQRLRWGNPVCPVCFAIP